MGMINNSFSNLKTFSDFSSSFGLRKGAILRTEIVLLGCPYTFHVFDNMICKLHQVVLLIIIIHFMHSVY